MANATDIKVPQGVTFSVIEATAAMLRAPKLVGLGVYNVPADAITSTFAQFIIPYNREAQGMDVTQGTVLAVVRGLIDNPKLVAWYFTLDGHDFYVLKLGTQGKTLVFDLSTGQWSWWTSSVANRWRASIGMNWLSSRSIPYDYGSNVIVGDDSSGILWVLDPMYGVDDAITGDATVPFPRVATGQVTTTGRKFLPCYSVDLTASVGNPALEGNQVFLEYSDDQGHTFILANAPQVSEATNYEQEFTWRSMGQIRAPGRLLRITDNGAFKRINSLDVNN